MDSFIASGGIELHRDTLIFCFSIANLCVIILLVRRRCEACRQRLGECSWENRSADIH